MKARRAPPDILAPKPTRNAVSQRTSATATPDTLSDLRTLLAPTRDGASVEERLLWRCARTSLTPDDVSAITMLGERLSDTQWEHLVSQARAHGVVNLLFAHICAAGLQARLPASLAAQLRLDYGGVAISTRRLETALASLTPQLQAVGAPVIVVKGMALARRLYSDLALRPISDIDLIAHREDASLWTEALRAEGFTPLSGRSQPLSKHVLRFREWQFRNTRGQTIEIHVNVCRYPAYQRAFANGPIWERARPLNNTSALALAPADELSFLCMHYAVQHRIGRLIWLTDVAEIARRIPDDDAWNTLLTDIIARGVAAPVAVTLARARALLDASIPDPALRRLRQAALSDSEQRAWASAMRPMSGARWYLAQLAVVSTPLERATLLWNGAMSSVRRVRQGRRPWPSLHEGKM